MSLAATLTYNYFFLPPVGTFTIADPQNWVALVTFLVTSVLASDLATRARNQAAEANRRRHEVERLYRFSQRLLSAGNPIELLNAIPAADRGDVRGRGRRALPFGQAESLPLRHESPAAGCRVPESSRLRARSCRLTSEHSVCFAPLRLGSTILGSMGISGPVLSRGNRWKPWAR